VLRASFRSAVAILHGFKHIFWFSQEASHLFNEIGCPQRHGVVLRHVAGNAADFQSVTFPAVPARGFQ